MLNYKFKFKNNGIIRSELNNNYFSEFGKINTTEDKVKKIKFYKLIFLDKNEISMTKECGLVSIKNQINVEIIRANYNYNYFGLSNSFNLFISSIDKGKFYFDSHSWEIYIDNYKISINTSYWPLFKWSTEAMIFDLDINLIDINLIVGLCYLKSYFFCMNS